VARAQKVKTTPVVGILWHAGSEREEAIFLDAFRRGLRDLGYAEGRNITLVNTYAGEQYERFASNAADLVAQKVDVLVAVTRPAALAAQRATKIIPIVAVVVPDPVASGLVASLARPGGNITGLSNMGVDLSAKRMELLKEAISGLRRVVLLVNPGDSELARQFVADSRAAAALLQIEVQVIDVRAPEDLEPAFAKILPTERTGVIVNNDPMLLNERGRIADLALARNLPTMVFMGPMASAGGLMSYGPNIPEIFRRSASLVDKILKGAQPADLPVEQPTKFELVVNLKTAKALGITVPPSLLARADEVIE
jgi:putative ABC transport system substrate-binding protein